MIKLEEVIKIINILLDHLPDSNHNDESWNWCWEELSGEAQEAVKIARNKGLELLDRYQKEKK